MGTSSTEFDPYSQWLGIPPQEQPPDHYRLLGIGRFETDAEIIQAAADARMSLVRQYQMGAKGHYTQELLNELSAAKLTLLDTTTRIAYDQTLRQAATAADHRAKAVEAPTGTRPAWLAAPLPATPPETTSPDDTSVGFEDPTAVVIVSTDHVTSADTDASDETKSPAFARSWGLVLIVALLAAVVGLALGVSSIIVQRDGGESSPNSVVDGTGTGPVVPPADSVEPPEASNEPPVLVYSEADGSVNLVASTAQLDGDLQLTADDQRDVIAGWTSRNGTATWRFLVLQPGIYPVRITYAVTEDAEGCSFDFSVTADGHETRPDVMHHSVSMRGGPDGFIEDEDHLLVRRSGKHTLVVSTSTPTPRGLMRLQAIRLLQPSRD